MAIILFIVLVITESAFLIAEIAKEAEKREWNRNRMLVNLTELTAFAAMLLLPGIDLSFRFFSLAVILLIRILFTGMQPLKPVEISESILKRFGQVESAPRGALVMCDSNFKTNRILYCRIHLCGCYIILFLI